MQSFRTDAARTKRFVSDDRGVTAIEYGLIASLIAVVIVGAVTLVGTDLNAVFTTIGNDL
ncbi:Flp family type IVb pilin [Paraburkholderia aspalathi]|uniref:Flp family type IVb pilin n=1 Tax=Paraburkholderia aspalathi TaxID=1324617 RepID=UPI001FD0B51F|nr:Flp family type IVb pilin [Paraburkholderia aspalathi]